LKDADQLKRSVKLGYDQLVTAGKIERDPAQSDLVARLDLLSDHLADMTLAVKGSSLGWLFGRSRPKPAGIRGLYVYGSVGRGKTMLMDLFFDRAPIKAKRRVHFHKFMADAQDRIHKARQAILAGTQSGSDPISPVAEALAAEARLLCFDEFAVTDIADAMILGRLFTRLFELGTVVVATSNVAPDRLYWEGLNRSLFLPFIDLLKSHVDIYELDARTDYRSEREDDGKVYFSPLGAQSDAAIGRIWSRIAGNTAEPVDIPFRGRTIHVPAAADGAARFDFADLCIAPHAAADYLQIAMRFKTVVIEHIPVMGAAERNYAKRFINLIDTLYDAGVKLIVSAAAEPEGLYTVLDTIESFEFQRTVSRLREMRSEEYFAVQQDLAATAVAMD
jgi:cell division protein ZapE